MLRLVIDHSGPAAGLNVIHWIGDLSTGSLAQDAADAVSEWLDDISGAIAGAQIMRVRPQVQEVDEATGTLTGVVAVETTPITGQGGTNQAPQATSILFQWGTGQAVNGRFLKGRTYVPGLSAGVVNAQGELSAGTIGILAPASEILAGSNGFGIWSPTAGVIENVNSATVWNELAVQRRRRS